MLGALLLVGWALAGQADVPADAAFQREVGRLVRQLEAPQLAERDAAEDALVKLGPKVLDFLPPPAELKSPEVKSRIARIQQKLQRVVAESAAKPALITLRGNSLPLSKFLAALAEQSGNKIVRKGFGQPENDPTLKVDFEKTPFWQALDQALDQAGLTVYPFGQQRAVYVVPPSEGQLPRLGRACYSGPFRFEAIQVLAQRDLRDPAGNSLRVKLEVSWEPRLRPIGLKQRLRDLEASDENGKTLPVENEQSELEVPASGQNIAVELLLPWKLPPRQVREIARLKGTLMAMIPGRIETFRFGNLLAAKHVEKRVAGVTVTLDRVEKSGDLWQVSMRVRFDYPGDALESHRGWILENEAYLEGPDGKPIPFSARNMDRPAANEVGMVYGFALDGPPTKHVFVYKTPTAIVTTGFDYELKDIKLP